MGSEAADLGLAPRLLCALTVHVYTVPGFTFEAVIGLPVPPKLLAVLWSADRQLPL